MEEVINLTWPVLVIMAALVITLLIPENKRK